MRIMGAITSGSSIRIMPASLGLVTMSIATAPIRFSVARKAIDIPAPEID